MNFRRSGFWLVGLGYALTLGACAGVSSEVGQMDGEGGAGNGECEPGQQRPAGDGCNTCTCDDSGSWGCTELACGCEEGATQPAGDGCNTCTCSAGEWVCTDEACEECTLGDMQSSDCGSCWCADNGDGPTWNCTTIACFDCTPGETKPADDGCNTCSCTNEGKWSCTDEACSECMPGETKEAGDGCNTCSCFGGSWGCTMKFCGDPLVCDAGEADCNGDPADGCETSIASDEMNCGACGNVCNFPGGLGACVSGQCAVGECQTGYANCNGLADDGCEAQIGPGGCATRCEVPGAVTDPTPASGTCECPEGTVCVRGSLEDPAADSEYCYPIPEGCSGGLGSCGCMAECACPEGAAATCYDEMSLGGFIVNCAGFPPPRE